jgi:hypothetical protein
VRTALDIIDKRTGKPVRAQLFDEVTVDHFIETQEEWRPVVVEAARRLSKLSHGTPTDIPRHFHWDWSRKKAQLYMLAIRFYGIEFKGKLQGIMKLETVGHVCRLPLQRGRPLIYIDYLEVAPWNVKQIMKAFGESPKYADSGEGGH